MLRTGLVAALTVACAACSTVDRYHVPPPGIVDDVRPPAAIIYRGREKAAGAKTSATAFLLAYDRAYDASVPGAVDVQDRDLKASDMTRLGMTLVELRCELFFQSIGRSSQKLAFARRELEIVSSALTTTLGLVGASDDAVAGLGIASGGSLATLANYENVFFFSPEVGKVYHLVEQAFGAMRGAIEKPGNMPRDFDAALRVLKPYQTVCTAHEIRRLVNEAVDSGKVRAVIEDDTAKALDAASQRFLAAMATAIAVPAVTIEDAVLIDWALQDDVAATDLDFICQAFDSADLRDAVCSGGVGAKVLTDSFRARKPALQAAVGSLRTLQGPVLAERRELLEKAKKASAAALDQARDDVAAAQDAATLARAEAAAATAVTVATDTVAAAAPLSQPAAVVVPTVTAKPVSE